MAAITAIGAPLPPVKNNKVHQQTNKPNIIFLYLLTMATSIVSGVANNGNKKRWYGLKKRKVVKIKVAYVLKSPNAAN